MAHSARNLLFCLMALVLSACGSGGGSPGTPAPSDPVDMVRLESPVPDSVVLNKAFPLTWNASGKQGETRWGVTIYSNVSGTKQTVLTLTTSARSYRPLQLADNMTYSWKVEALNEAGDTVAVSDEWTFHTYPTRMIPFAGALDEGSYPDGFTAFDGDVYFTAYSPEHGREVWRKGGNAAAQNVADLCPGDVGSGPRELTVCGSRLYFSADDGEHGRELWEMSPGQPPVMACDLRPAETEGGENPGSDPADMVAVGETLYFSAVGPVGGEKTLWVREGGDAPAAVTRGAASEPLLSPERGVALNGVLYVSGVSPGAGRELWRVVGSVATRLVANAGGSLSDPKGFCPFKGKLYFRATQAGHGSELWAVGMDGSPFLVKEIAPGVFSGAPGELTVSGDALFFAATTPEHGRELWRSDGTADGTVRVADIVDGAMGSQPQCLTSANGMLYFTAKTGGEGMELWRSDGTPSGTRLIKDICPGATGSSVQEIVPFGDGVFFRATEGGSGKELWFSNGEAETTFRVADLLPGEQGGYPECLTVIGGTLWFRADDGAGGVELWQSDGPYETTRRTDNINPYLNPDVDDVVRVGNRMVMVATSGEYGRELFTMGDDGRVTVLCDINDGYGGSDPDHLFVSGSRLFFSATDLAQGRELWVTDGTLEGTRYVRDLVPGSGGSDPGHFTEFNGSLFFLARRDSSWQLWQTDGSADGTVPVRGGDGAPLALGSSEADLAMAAGETRLFFRKGDGLWAREPGGQTDAIGGVRNPSELFPVAGSLLFAGETDGEAGPATLRLLTPGQTEAGDALMCGGAIVEEPQGFFRTGAAIFFSGRLHGGSDRVLLCFSPVTGQVSRVTDGAGRPLFQPEGFCGAGGLLWCLAGPSGGQEIWRVPAGAYAAQRLSELASGGVGEKFSSPCQVGNDLYFLSSGSGQDNSCLYVYRDATVQPVLDYHGRVLSRAKNLFPLDGMLFLTAVNPDATSIQPAQGLWVTSPVSF